MAATLLWDDGAASGQKPQENSLQDLFVFGYACKLFRDDEKAKHIDEGRHLIPWMGDEKLMIDRYDGRGHLPDLTRHDADLIKRMPVEMSEEEKAVEAACDEERYLELVTDVQEKAMYEEEEWKRYYESLHEGTYNAVGFSYEQPKAVTTQTHEAEEPQEEEEEEEVFVPPPELMVPEGVQLPVTVKEHARIEKTAAFIAKHGAQMEIMLKMKQAKNIQFEFLSFEKPLNQYYLHVLKMIKGGKYRPQQEQEAEQDQSDQHYLHPSLSTTTTITPLPPPPPPKPVVMPKFSIEDTAYGQLVSSLKKYHKQEEDKSSLVPPPLPPFMAQPDYGSSSASLDTLPSSHPQSSSGTAPALPTAPTPSAKEERVEPPPPGTEVMGPLPRPPSLNDVQGCENRSSPQPQIVPPPPDVQPIIDRMAMYVAKNGLEFEYVVKSKHDQRFSFLEPGHVHFQYYDFKKNMFLKEAELKKRLEAKQAERERLKQEEEAAAAAALANRSISFSIKGRNKEPESVNALKRPLFDYDSSEGEGEEGSREGAEKESKSRSISPDPGQAPPTTTPVSLATSLTPEVKPAPVEDLEKKQAEERLKDKLATAARDKLAACTKEKQLQAERKKKAAMFINLLRIVKESPAPGAAEKGREEGEAEVKSSPSVTPSCSKPASPVPEVFEYNNRSGTPTILNQDLLHKRKTSRSKSPVVSSRKKRRKKSRTPPSAYANPHRSPPRFNIAQRRSHSPRRGVAGCRRLSPIRPFRSRRSPSPHVWEWSPVQRSRSPLRKKASLKRSRSRSQTPSQSKHKKKHKRSRSKTPKKKKKDKTSGGSKDHDSAKSGRSHDKSADKHKERDKKKDKEKKKDKDKKDKERKERDKKDRDRKEKEKKERKDKDRHKSKDSDKHSGSSKSDKSRERGKDVVGEPRKPSATTETPQPQPLQLSPTPSASRADQESKVLSPVPQIISSSSSESNSSSEDEGVEVEEGEVGRWPQDGEGDSSRPPRADGQTTADTEGSQDGVQCRQLS